MAIVELEFTLTVARDLSKYISKIALTYEK